MPRFGLELGSWPSLEAQVAAIADDIAYDNHDIDDGLRSGHPRPRRAARRAVRRAALGGGRGAPSRARPDAQDQGAGPRRDRRDGRRRARRNRRRIAEAGVETIDEVRAAGRQLVGFSAGDGREERALKRHLYAHLYDSAALTPIRIEAQRIVADLAATLSRQSRCLPAGLAARRGRNRPPARHRRLSSPE
jgi:dGTPase